MGSHRIQAIFYFNGNIYINKNNKNEIFNYMMLNRRNIDENLLKRIKGEFDVDAEIIFKFSNEIRSDVHTYLVKLSEIQEEKFEKLSIGVLDKLKKHSRIYLMQSDIEMNLREINNNISNLINEYKNTIIISKLEEEYYKATKVKYEKDIVDGNSKNISKAIIGSIILAILCQYMFLWEYLGVSVVIYTVIFSILAIILNRDKLIYKGKKFYFFLGSSWIFSFMFMFFSNYLLNALNISIIILFFNAAILVGKYDYEVDENLLKISFINIFVGLSNILRISKVITFKIKWEKKVKVQNENRKYILQGILILSVILIVVIPLLMSADDIFNNILVSICTSIDFNVDEIMVKRMCAFIIIFVYNISYIWTIKYDHRVTFKKKKRSKNFKYETAIIILAGLDIVYGIFSVLQFSYLYGSGNSGLPNGMIYSDYARKGFFELVAITLINISFIIIGNIKIEELPKKRKNHIKIGFSLIIIFTYNILFSAFYRMMLYIEEFGYTRLRVMVQFTIVILAVLLIMIIIVIWKESWKIKENTLVVITVMYLIFNLFNMDGFIMRKNIERYNEGKKLDIQYFDSLGWDGMKSLYELQKNGDIEYKNDKERREIENSIWDFVNRKSTYDNREKLYTNKLDRYDKWFEYCNGKNFIKKY